MKRCDDCRELKPNVHLAEDLRLRCLPCWERYLDRLIAQHQTGSIGFRSDHDHGHAHCHSCEDFIDLTPAWWEQYRVIA